MVFRRTRVIEPGDIDELGHVNNVTWLYFVVELADAHSSSVGLDLDAYRDIGGLWIVRRHEVDYRGQARVGDEVIEETWVASFKGARSVRETRFTTLDGRELVHAVTHWAYIDAATQRPRRVDATVVERFPIHEVAP